MSSEAHEFTLTNFTVWTNSNACLLWQVLLYRRTACLVTLAYATVNAQRRLLSLASVIMDVYFLHVTMCYYGRAVTLVFFLTSVTTDERHYFFILASVTMDFAKAFDKVPHKRLLYKLDFYGIRGSTHKWIDSWLSERSQKVVLDGRASDPVPVLSGVPQGSVLGPVLFLIFINDLPDNIRSSVRLFADDCVLYRNVKSPLDCQILQDDLNSLAKWEMDWQMKFNVSKCHSMRVTRLHPSRHIDFNYTLHQQTLEQVQSAKYLGLTITDDLDWGQHISEITCKATKTLGFLRRNLALAPRHTKEVAYKTLVRPQLEYAAPIWHPYHETQIEKVEKVQRTAARWTCRRWRNTSSVGEMLDELEWPSLESRRERSSLTFFYKIHSGTVSLDKDKYLTPAPNLRHTRASHESQYTRPFAYSDALKNSFFPRTIPVWNSLPSSVVLSKTIEEFKASI